MHAQAWVSAVERRGSAPDSFPPLLLPRWPGKDRSNVHPISPTVGRFARLASRVDSELQGAVLGRDRPARRLDQTAEGGADGVSRTRVIIADDRREVRSGLRVLLEEEQARFVVIEAADLSQLMSQVREPCADLVLLDWELGPISGPDILAMLKGASSSTRVVALSARPEARSSALTSGAAAFVLKADCVEAVLTAVRSATGSRVDDQWKEGMR